MLCFTENQKSPTGIISRTLMELFRCNLSFLSFNFCSLHLGYAMKLIVYFNLKLKCFFERQKGQPTSDWTWC